MATRLPYGSRLSYELLDRIASGEEWLREILGESANIRLRVHGDVARIETDESGMELLLRRRSETVRKLQNLGFPYITLDLEGFRSGSMDRGIGEKKNNELCGSDILSICAGISWRTEPPRREKRCAPHWEDGTPAYTIKSFGVVNRYDLSREFPALTLRRTALKTCMDELLWIWQKNQTMFMT